MSKPPQEVTVDGNDIAVAACDYGGEGPELLLLHGLGANLRHWDQFAQLAEGRRLVAVDLRGHGKSGDGPWAWDAVLDDLEAVVDVLDLRAPAVAGHSLGGMLAAMWACRRPECPAVVSIDGHRPVATHPENYAGMADDQLHADLARLNQMFDVQAQAASYPIGADQLAAVLAQQQQHHPELAPAALQARLERNTVTRDGQNYLLPGSQLLAAVRAAPEFTDSLPVFADVSSPTLMLVATQDPPGLPEGFTALTQAFRVGLKRDLEPLSARGGHFEMHEVDAGHDLVTQRPHQVAALTFDFLRRFQD